MPSRVRIAKHSENVNPGVEPRETKQYCYLITNAVHNPAHIIGHNFHFVRWRPQGLPFLSSLLPCSWVPRIWDINLAQVMYSPGWELVALDILSL